MVNNEDCWRTIDFRPAPPGWFVVYVDSGEAKGYFMTPLAGWLTQEAARWHRYEIVTDRDTPAEDRLRRIVIAEVDEFGEVNTVDSNNFWYVLGPGDPQPTAEALAEHLKSEQKLRDLQAKLADQRAQATSSD